MNLVYELSIVLIVLTAKSYSLAIQLAAGICCKSVWTIGPLSTKTAYDGFINLDLNCDALRCVYRTCGGSGYINGVYYNKNLPMEWSRKEQKFVHGNSYCGLGKCNIFGCNCDGGCLVADIKDDPNV